MPGYDYWKNYELWKREFPEKKFLEWRDNWLDNGYCEKCRFCCGPQGEDAPFPMGLLDSQVNADTPKEFYLLSPEVAYIGARGCKSLGAKGCRLDKKQKPVACGLFPITLVNGRLYLYQQCPAVFFNPLCVFLEIGAKAARFLESLSLEDLRRVSIHLDCETLASKYVDLRIKIFDGDHKEVVFE